MKTNRTLGKGRLRWYGEPRPFEFGVVEWCLAVAVGGVVIALATQLAGCSGNLKKDARTANDVADMACELFATEQAELAGLTLSDLTDAVSKACDYKDAARPYLDALLAAQRESSTDMAGRMGIPASDAD